MGLRGNPLVGREDSLRAHRGQVVLVTVVHATGLRKLKSWETALRERLEGVHYIRIADVPADPPLTHDEVAEKLRQRVPEEVSILIDLEGEWRKAFGLAAAALYLPQLLPLVATDLASHGHCLGIYARLFPLLTGLAPGVSARIASDLGEPWEEVVFFGVAGAVALMLLGGTTFALRRGRLGGWIVAVATALTSATLSMAAVALIRA